MEKRKDQPIDYKTHILIGVRSDGVMTVLCDWPHVPLLAEVQEQIKVTRGGYAKFALCTPTSILPGNDQGGGSPKPRCGRWA